MKHPSRQGINSDHDILETLISTSKSKNIKVYACFNVFAEGSYFRNDIGMPDILLKHGQYVIDNDGQIVLHQESGYVAQGEAKIAYLNPADDTARQLEYDTIKEVLEQYDIDGILLDRCRFDNDLADFSDLTRKKFIAYCKARGKLVEKWPDDVYTIKNGHKLNGPLIIDWWEFRAQLITSFVQSIRELIDEYNVQQQKQVQLATYVGSWYEYAYVHGINWAAKSYEHQQLFNWSNHDLYTTDYMKTGYAELLDFIIVGAYQQTWREIEQYLTVAYSVTNSKVPVIAGFALPYAKEDSFRMQLFKLGQKKCSGIMIFDHCHIDNWEVIELQ